MTPEQYKTQREEDAAHGYVLTKSMKEDERKRGIPLFLQTQNRVPLTKKQQARIDEMRASTVGRQPERTDWRKPRSMSWEQWDAIQAEKEAARREKTMARIAELKERMPPRPKKPPRPSVAELLEGAVIRVVTKKNPYRPGSAGHAVFAVYKDGMTTAAFASRAAGKAGKRKPADLLMFDVRKGHVKLEKKETK